MLCRLTEVCQGLQESAAETARATQAVLAASPQHSLYDAILSLLDRPQDTPQPLQLQLPPQLFAALEAARQPAPLQLELPPALTAVLTHFADHLAQMRTEFAHERQMLGNFLGTIESA